MEPHVKEQAPFQRDDLDEFDRIILQHARGVLSAEEAFDLGRPDGFVIMRHDVDHDLDHAVKFAAWESERGYGSTYYLLHTAQYWRDAERLKRGVAALQALGREIGFHNDALAAALIEGGDPHEIVAENVEQLRTLGVNCRSTVAHGNKLCHIAHFVNDEIFTECARPKHGDPGRIIESHGRCVKIDPRPLNEHRFEFDPLWQPRDRYISDSGGRWYGDLEPLYLNEREPEMPTPGLAPEPARIEDRLMVLLHPIWWREAF
jgi:hypothetical protein